MLRSAAVAVALFVIGAFVPAASQGAPPDSPVGAKRDTEPVVLKGTALGAWAVPANQTVKLPFMDLAGEEACQATIDPTKIDPTKLPQPGEYDPTEGGIGVPDPGPATGGAVAYDPEACPPADYAKPELDTADYIPLKGTDVDRLLGFRYDKRAGRFDQIPFQVDEVFTRYLDNSRSGFAIYSGQDQHTTYAYDREGFRYTDHDPADPCVAIPRMVDGERLEALPDPVPGLDTNDELAFMYSDAGPRAPQEATLPAGIADAQMLTVADPLGLRKPRFVYVMRAAEQGGATAAYSAANGYVRYDRDPNAGRFAFSESSYDSYGNATDGPYCDPVTGERDTSHGEIAQRRPLDGATIATKRYRFRYDGRWLLTRVEISPDEGKTFGPDLVDRWKARAFAQDPSSETPCCGYEEEDSNWGGSSILLGEKVGPVRAIRETWGADSGTNVIRRETFYRGEMRQKTWLRVHVIPPLDGIYAQWDFNAGRVTKFFNPRSAVVKPDGWDIDGRNDEVFGNLDDPCNVNYDDPEHDGDRDDLSRAYRQLYQSLEGGGYSWCEEFPYHQSVDLPDPTMADANAALSWSMVSGPDGSIVDRTSATTDDVSPAGTAQSLLAVPYYRDDACFDDGTGSDPGPELFPRDPRRERESGANGARKCWRGDPAIPNSDAKFWQGSIATHGMHILFLADSDNARLTVPVSEIVAETRMVMLPGAHKGASGESYGRGFEKQVLAAPGLPAALKPAPPEEKPPSEPAPSEQPTAAAAAAPSTKGASGTSSAPAAAKPAPAAKGKKAKAKKRCLKKAKTKKAKKRCRAKYAPKKRKGGSKRG